MFGRKIVRGAVLAFAVAAPLVVGAGNAQASAPASARCSPPADPAPVVCWTPEESLNIGSQSTGAGAGRVTFNPFSIQRKIDRSSP